MILFCVVSAALAVVLLLKSRRVQARIIALKIFFDALAVVSVFVSSEQRRFEPHIIALLSIIMGLFCSMLVGLWLTRSAEGDAPNGGQA